MDFTFLLVNFNMFGLLDECFKHIERQMMAGDWTYQVIIADNSTDPAFRMPEDYGVCHPHARVIFLERNDGWVAALNTILPEVSGEFVFIMHPDVEMQPGCIAVLREFMREHPDAGVVSPDLVYPDGRPNKIRTRFPTLRSWLARNVNMVTHILFKRYFLVSEKLWDHLGDVGVDMVMSVCMMVRREALAEAGLVTRALRNYCANDYLCSELGKRGWTCHYTASARAVHKERYAEREGYSSQGDSNYKRSAMPVAALMLADELAFLSTTRSWPAILAFRILAVFEYTIHLMATLKLPGHDRSQHIKHCLDALRVVTVGNKDGRDELRRPKRNRGVTWCT